MGRSPVVLVTGASGQVGSALRPLLPDARFPARPELDVTDARAVTTATAGVDVVVHLAALTDVDGCEADPARAMAVNAEGTRNVAEACAVAGARMVYLSTDYVFDGSKSGEYAESDPPAPLNHYGRSKLAGESHVVGLPSGLIVRTSWVIGRGRNFVRTILEHARQRPELEVVDDQRGRPTLAADLAWALVALLRDEVTGLVHVANDGGACTWADLAALALEYARCNARVVPIDTESYARKAARLVAPRPRNSTLMLAKAKALGLPLRDWRPSLRAYVEALG